MRGSAVVVILDQDILVIERSALSIQCIVSYVARRTILYERENVRRRRLYACFTNLSNYK